MLVEEHDSFDYSTLRVFALAGDDTACGQFRVIRPLRYLERLGAVVQYVFSCNLQQILDFRPNVVVFQRQISAEVERMVQILRSIGILTIYELDDNLHRVSPQSPAYSTYKPGSTALRYATSIMSKVHGCTFSTEDLSEFYSGANPNNVVVHNSLDLDMRPWMMPFRYRRREDRIILGWTGGAQHQQDTPILNEVIPVILRKYPKVDIALYTNPEIALQIFEDWKVPPSRRILIAPQRFDDYPYWLGMFDIGMAPIFNDEFNRAKSNLKLLEYSIKGIPCVASDVSPYRRSFNRGFPVLIAATNSEWIDHLSLLLENEQRRTELGQQAKEYVIQHYDMAVRCKDFVQAWLTIADRAKSERKPNEGKVQVGREKPGRNDPCPCGSGRKYKKCCYPAYGR